ncbi:DUF885 family protein [Granulicella tundricola]|uniref:DUF885 domain-containing protein n=1 Tax=Granulicella tundricola (strain ATCC BAA-1859 / DSM 23138 / MP5ACTX9) TaxID=1198114 RepID=E8X6D2_GRATM|nr:DUF885 family protein [Granulicella tundricola]ADW71016.1 protein of unknown function DUF885 [Granulicella tundricola MP5ACTX9]
MQGLRVVAGLLLLIFCTECKAETLQDFAKEFWAWRAREQPFSADDIPRIDRPADMKIDWSPAAIERDRLELAGFEVRFARLADASAPVARLVDYRLMGSALARVHWELDIDKRWQRDPSFYVDQTLGAIYLPLLPPPPFEVERQSVLVARMRSFPETVKAAKANLTDMRQPFVDLATGDLDRIGERLGTVVTEVKPKLDAEHRRALEAALPGAVKALEEYRAWLLVQKGLKQETAIGRENYLYFLRQVALVPYTPEEMVLMSRQELDRTMAFSAYEAARNGELAPLPVFKSVDEQMQREERDEVAIRAYMESHHILTVPKWMMHYRNFEVPAYVKPLQGMGPADDLTSPTRLTQNGTSYISAPKPGPQGFFATSLDPRPIILHEGVPGHYFQESLDFANADAIRRHYYDSGPNEGIGFYSEEMMMVAGLFDQEPRTRQLIYNFMKLRSLRVGVDVKLALGEFTPAQAMDYLSKTVPMSMGTARGEVALFASAPGQAITYQIGKLQIMKLLADARLKQGSAFLLLTFHDFVWANGNVPLSLQRWELLGDASEVPALKLQ